MLKSKNVRIMLLVLVLAITYTFVFGCDDTGEAYDNAKSAVRAIEDSDVGVTLTTVGNDISDAAGEMNLSGDMLKKVQQACLDLGYNADCSDKE